MLLLLLRVVVGDDVGVDVGALFLLRVVKACRLEEEGSRSVDS